MINIQIRDMLIEIAKTAYPDVKHTRFYLKVENREMNSKNGKWVYPQEGKMAEIWIYNLSRGTRQILKTSVHELTHNTEYSIYKETGHSPRFYMVYKKLLEAAIDLGLLTAEDINDIADTRDIKQLIRHQGPINRVADSNKIYKEDQVIIKVKNSFSIKDKLKERNYRWNSTEQVWMLELSQEHMDEEKTFLLSITEESNLIISSYSELEIEAIGYIVVGGKTFDIKDKLKERGYVFRGYNQPGNVWVKRVPMTEVDDERFVFSYSDDITVSVVTKK